MTLPRLAGLFAFGVDPRNLNVATMTTACSTRITVSQAALHYQRSRRWVRMQVSLLSDEAKAALRPGTVGRHHERDFDREALFSYLDSVTTTDVDVAYARLGYLAGYVGRPRRRDAEGVALCENARCRHRVNGRRRLCEMHTTRRAHDDRNRRKRSVDGRE